MNTTPASLLEKLRQPHSEAAWARFVELYTPLMCHWAQRLGLAGDDADDLVQDVFSILVRELPTFTYEPGKRFRGWLWTVLVNRFREQQRRRASQRVREGGPALEQVAVPDPAEEAAEKEYRNYLVNRALRLMQTDFEPLTWKACWEHVVLGRPSREVAAELGITVNGVHLAKSRVLRRLRGELAGLLD